MSIFVHIIEVTTGLEAHALRYAAECWGASVGVTWVGNAQQIVDVLSSKPVHDVLIISGHGDERGLLLPPLAAEIKERYPYNDVITPANFAEFVRLDGNIVINSSCSGGMPELAQVFLEAGTRAYIGPEDYPHGSAALMYVLHFLYAYLHNERNVDEAHRMAATHADDRRQFVLHSPPRSLS